MSIPRRVSSKIENETYCACVALSDALGVCRASNALLRDKIGRSLKSVEYALTQLEVSGRIHRTAFYIRPGVTYRDIRCFPGYYNFRRKLTWCENRHEYLLLKKIAEFKPSFQERYTPAHQDLTGDIDDPFD